MKFPIDKIYFAVALLFWLGVGFIVLDHNLGWGTTILRWPNPAAPTAMWSWDATEQTPTIVEPRSGQWMRVTLPRGFQTATLEVRTVDPTGLVLRAEARNSQKDIAQASEGSTHWLSFSWADLVARGKTFRFRVENPTDQSAEISSIRLITTR